MECVTPIGKDDLKAYALHLLILFACPPPGTESATNYWKPVFFRFFIVGEKNCLVFALEGTQT